MIDTLLLSLKLVSPMCVFMIIGYVLQRKHYFTPKTITEVSKMLFSVVIPLSVGKSIYSSDLKHGGDWSTLVFAGVTIILTYLISAMLAPHLDSDRKRIPVIVQGISKSNYVLVGLSLVAMMYGDDVGMAGMIVAVSAPLNSTVSTIIFESYRGKDVPVSHFIRKVLTNPIVAVSLVSLALNLLDVKLPKVILNDIVGKIGGCASPMALMMMGAGFNFEYASRYKKQIGIATIGRLIIVPLIQVPVMILMGYRGVNLMALMLLAATPAAVNSYSMAVAMDADGELAGAIVAVSSICSVGTLFIWVSILSGLGML